MSKGYRVAMMESSSPFSFWWAVEIFEPKAIISWFTIMLAYSFLLTAFSRVHAKWLRKSESREREYSFPKSFWHFWSLHLSIGDDPQPTSLSGRILSSYWGLLNVIIMALYTANLVTMVNNQNADRPLSHVNQLEDHLLKDSNFKAFTFR